MFEIVVVFETFDKGLEIPRGCFNNLNN